MDLIDKEQNLSIGFDDFVQNSLQTFLELPTELGARNQ
jgi:hypothetical protein